VKTRNNPGPGTAAKRKRARISPRLPDDIGKLHVNDFSLNDAIMLNETLRPFIE
jgi:hypothetical protein